MTAPFLTTKPEATPQLMPLSEQALLIEKEIAGFYDHLRKLRADFDRAVEQATLRSREQAAEILNASTAQVGRWTTSGELTVVELDRRPRYRLQDLEGFAAARVRVGRPFAQNAKSGSSVPAKHEKQNQA